MLPVSMLINVIVPATTGFPSIDTLPEALQRGLEAPFGCFGRSPLHPPANANTNETMRSGDPRRKKEFVMFILTVLEFLKWNQRNQERCSQKATRCVEKATMAKTATAAFKNPKPTTATDD
jgi:hypothetical protein